MHGIDHLRGAGDLAPGCRRIRQSIGAAESKAQGLTDAGDAIASWARHRSTCARS